MKLAVGLGNPGNHYARTRHNVGFRVVEALARASHIGPFEKRFAGLYASGSVRHAACPTECPGGRRQLDGSSQAAPELGVLLPQTFMNRSGESVAAALAGLPVGDLSSDFAVVVDDLDLPFGRLRIRPSGGAGGHRGLESLIEQLQTSSFPRLRFGIGRPGPGEDPVQFVLAPFSAAEEQELGDRIAVAVAALETLFRDGVLAAMNEFNRAPESDRSDEAEKESPKS